MARRLRDMMKASGSWKAKPKFKRGKRARTIKAFLGDDA